MDSLKRAIASCNVPLLFDSVTIGDGNCLPRSLFQQCQRPSVRKWLMEYNPLKIPNSHSDLRSRLVQFAVKESTDAVRTLKVNYEAVFEESWEAYWYEQSFDKVWADETFLNVAALYLGLDVNIITLNSKPEKPFLTIQGGNTSLNRPIFFLGLLGASIFTLSVTLTYR